MERASAGPIRRAGTVRVAGERSVAVDDGGCDSE